MAFAIIDTNVYIDHWQKGAAANTLELVRQRYVVRQSAVVLSELRRGARTREAVQLVVSLRQISTVIWEPTQEDWWRAGELIRSIGDVQGWETAKRREFQNDALIALTALRHGATLVTSNVTDFALLARALKVSVLRVR
jgi:predicted nucleic acid-binding protein